MKQYVWAWLVTGAIFTVFLFSLGWWLGKGHKLVGILVDDRRNRVSLAKFQLAVWTVVIFSAFSVVMIAEGSVDIYLPAEVWGLVGISVSSMAGAAIIKGVKIDSQPAAPGGGVPVVVPFGVLAVSDEARFRDIFMGDELENQDFVDLSKVQMFFLTLVAVVGYVYAMYGANLGKQPADLTEDYCAYFPPLSSALLTLLAISHTGYLTVKAAPHTQTA
jgi:hypothetical protein